MGKAIQSAGALKRTSVCAGVCATVVLGAALSARAAATDALGSAPGAGTGPLQAPPGAYVRVATFEESASAIPPEVWNQPAGIDMTAGGEVFVSDSRLRRVTVHDLTGRQVREFGRGPGTDDLVAPGQLATDETRDRVYVADPGAGRVAVYTLAGAPVALWPVAGPAGVAVAPDGRVVVSDTDGDRVRVFQPDGTETGGWGGTGAGPAQLDYPAGVAVAADLVVWVADRANGRLVATTLDGAAVRTVKLTAPELVDAELLDVAVAGDDLWVATSGGIARVSLANGFVRGHLKGGSAQGVTVHGDSGALATILPETGDPGVWHYRPSQSTGDPEAKWGGPVLVPGFFDGLEALSIGDDGKALLLDVPARIQRLALTGVVEGQILAPDPVEVDADATGRVFAASADTVRAYAPDGTQLWEARVRSGVPSEEPEVMGLAWDATGNRVVALDATGKHLLYLGADGSEHGDWRLRPRTTSEQYWTDLAVGADGTRFALDAGGSQVRGWDPVDVLVAEVDLPERGTRIDVGPDGSVFVLFASGWARRFARDGTQLAEWDVTRLDRGHDSRPVDIAVDAAGRVYIVDGGANIVSVYAWDPSATPPLPPSVEEGCEVRPDKLALPSEILLGDTVEVTLQVRGVCAGSRSAADIGLLVDTSMDRGQLKAAQKAAEYFVSLMDPASDLLAVQPGTSSGRLTNDVQYIHRTIRRLDATDTYDLGNALTLGEQELFGRRGRQGVKKVMIVLFGSQLADDITWWQRNQIERAAGQAKRRGAEIFAIGFGRNTDESILQDIATDRNHVLRSRGSWQLAAIYEEIAGRIKPTVLMESLTVTDEIPANMTYVPGSSEPPAVLDGRTLTWHLENVPLVGTGMRYQLRPEVAGEWPTNVFARGEYTEPGGATGAVDFPVPIVRVGLPTATPTVTPAGTPTRAPTATPGPTRTPRPGQAYLPVAHREECRPARLDVALVIDASTSMLELSAAGRSKLEAATEAAGAFLDHLALGRDLAAVVAFHHDAMVLQPLTADRGALDGALAGIAVESQSRVDLGIALARAELLGERARLTNRPVMIVLTDGRANPVSPDIAVAEAAAAKGAGILIFTVGVGADLDFDALAAMASRPEYFHAAPDAEELKEIYEEIARAIPCGL